MRFFLIGKLWTLAWATVKHGRDQIPVRGDWRKTKH